MLTDGARSGWCDQPLNPWEHGSWDLSLHEGPKSQVPSYDIDAYVETLLGGEAQDLLRVLLSQKLRPNSQHKSCEYFCIKWSRSKFKDILAIFARFLEAQKFGLCLHVGTCDPMWTDPNRIGRDG